MKKLLDVIVNFLKKDRTIADLNPNLESKLAVITEGNINKVVMNSEKIESGDLFFAINNGNNYVIDALEKSAFLIVCDRVQPVHSDRIIYVEDTVKFMQQIANLYRKEAKFNIIGITGSNGKTTTKDILYSILSEKYKVEKTQGNYNNHIGLPFTILSTKSEIEYLILEMGMSDLKEIDLLCKISEPDYAIITNIGLSHMEILKTKENVFKAKTEMLQYVEKENTFLSGDDEYLVNVPGNKIGFNSNMKEEIGCKNYIIRDFKQTENGIEFSLNNEHFVVDINGEYNANNCGICIALGEKIGLSVKNIRDGLKNLTITPMRFQKLYWNNMVVVNDAYNASPISMELGLKSFYKIYKDKYKIAVLGDMLELGDKEIEYHEDTLQLALELGYDEIIIYGSRMKKALERLKNKCANAERILFLGEKEEIKRKILSNKTEEAVLFLKGSRGMKLEEILMQS